MLLFVVVFDFAAKVTAAMVAILQCYLSVAIGFVVAVPVLFVGLCNRTALCPKPWLCLVRKSCKAPAAEILNR